MIISTCQKDGATLNALAAAGQFPPVEFTFDGQVYRANTVSAACDWLKARGYYRTGKMVEWRIGDA